MAFLQCCIWWNILVDAFGLRCLASVVHNAAWAVLEYREYVDLFVRCGFMLKAKMRPVRDANFLNPLFQRESGRI
jgi:hypothetical protein